MLKCTSFSQGYASLYSLARLTEFTEITKTLVY